MKIWIAAATLSIAIGLASAEAIAQNIYKCADGYSQQPCPGGTLVQAADERTQAQKAQTDAATRRDARTANAMEKSRLAQEGQAVPGYTPPPRFEAPGNSAAPDTASRPKTAKPVQPQTFTAVVPGEAKHKKKKSKAKKPKSKDTAPALQR